MTDLRDLLNNRSDVAIFPDPDSCEQLRKVREFWDGTGAAQSESLPDLSALSDAEIEERLAALEVADARIPENIGNLLAPKSKPWRWKTRLAVAASLAAGVVFGGFMLVWQENTGPNTVPPQIAVSGSEEDTDRTVDPYLFRQTDPASQSVEPDNNGPAIRKVQLPGTVEEIGLNRVELRELQSLLNRFGYGPIPQHGLPSSETDAAISAFREAHDLVERGANIVVLDLLREIARQAALNDLKERRNNQPTAEGDKQ